MASRALFRSLWLIRMARLCGDVRAATAIEFALVAPLLFALMIAILETSLIYFASAALQTVTETTARKIVTGQAQSQALTQAQFRQAACDMLPAFMNCSKLYIDVQTASSFSSINPSAPSLVFDKDGNVTNSFNYTIGGSGDIVVIRVMYLWPVVSGPLVVRFRRMVLGGVGRNLPFFGTFNGFIRCDLTTRTW